MKGMTDLRAMLARLAADDDLLRITRPADPDLEIPALARATDMGPVALFENVTRYPGRRVVSNIFGSRTRIARWCGVETEYLPRHLADAALAPIPPQEIFDAPCHEQLVTSGIDILASAPVTRQTREDAGHVITGGIALVRDPDTGCFNGSYHRMRVLGPDSTCITIQAGRHLLEIARKYKRRGESHLPITVNVGAGPATLLACSGSTQQTLTPFGYDELGFAGALQAEPVRVTRARTQEGAWALADAELVLEGYIDMDRLTSEEDSGKDGVEAMMPEAGGYMGRAWRVWEFRVTALATRRDWLYWAPLAINMETTNLMAMPAEASIYDACRRISPRVFDTCHVLPAMRGCLGVVLRIARKSFRDEGMQTNLLFGALAAHSDLGWVVVVDHDIDLTNAEEVLWALVTRADVAEGMMITPRAKVSGMLAEGDAAGTGRKLAIDATAPFSFQGRYQRARFETVELAAWLEPGDVARVTSQQSDHLRSLLRRGL